MDTRIGQRLAEQVSAFLTALSFTLVVVVVHAVVLSGLALAIALARL